MLQVVADILRRRHSEGWLVGGSVRDLELGRFSPDLDIVVVDDPRSVAREISQALRVPWFVLSERHPTFRVMAGEGHVDVAAARGSGILDDLAERDFTVNAMALPIDAAAGLGGGSPLDPRELVDPFDGLCHLQERRLVAVSDRVFVDDPLRMLRAVRFCHVLGLEPDGGLCDAIARQAPLLARTAAERVMAEVSLTLAGGRAVDAVLRWQELGLLGVMFPELRGPRRLSAALEALGNLDDILSRPADWFPEAVDRLSGRLAQPVDGALSRPVALRLAGLLHRVPAPEMQQAGRRLKLSADAIFLLTTVSRHLSEDQVRPWPVIRESRRPGRAAVLFMWQAAPWEPEMIVLCTAASSRRSTPGIAGDGSEPARRLMQLWAERSAGVRTRLPIDGEVLMREFDLASGPLLGRVLREVRLAWEAGEIDSAQEALAAARGFLASEPLTESPGEWKT
jgi:tRNA nucleotidyltransferase/poly(A) polymerase